MTEYLRKKLIDEAIDGALTDYDPADSGHPTSPFKDSDRFVQLKNMTSQIGPSTKTSVTSTSTKTLRNKHRDAQRRRKQRQQQQTAEHDDTKVHVKRRRLNALKDALQIKLDLQQDIVVSTTGWQGRRRGPLPKKNFTKEEVQQEFGLVHFPWNGKDSHLLLDQDFNVVGILLGQPRDKVEQPGEWEATCQDAFEALKLAASSMTFSDKECNHRRGPFLAVPHGISFGGGQKEPKHLNHDSAEKNEVLETLMQVKSIQRICKFASEGMRLYGARNYAYMNETMEALREHYDRRLDPKQRLRRPYDKAVGVFPCRSFNLGEQSVSYPHTDDANLAQSWCSITPLGSFDATKGGQLILWDLGLVVDFPSASTILIPSALILHANTPISPNETRFSIVQYAAAGLFRWVENGFMSEEAFLAQATKDQIKEHAEARQKRWGEAVKMFTNLQELLPRNSHSDNEQ
ncbi:hypothetical protein H0H93_014763 [Arthromyces matolae]|nr:hypothetical protein H0H93_014763 [Arthromyces matolae]